MLALCTLEFGCAQGGKRLACLRQFLQPGGVIGRPVEQRLKGGLLSQVKGLYLQQPGLATFLQRFIGQHL